MYEDIYSVVPLFDSLYQNYVRANDRNEIARVYGLLLVLSWMELEGLYKKHIVQVAADGFSEKNELHKRIRDMLVDDRSSAQKLILTQNEKLPDMAKIIEEYKTVTGTPPSFELVKAFRDWVAHGQYYCPEKNLNTKSFDAKDLFQKLDDFKKQFRSKLNMN